MRVMLIKQEQIYELELPSKILGNYSLDDKDSNGNQRTLIEIVAKNGKWEAICDLDIMFLTNDNKLIENIILESYKFYKIYLTKEKETYLMYCMPVYDQTQVFLKTSVEGTYLIGNDSSNQIIYDIPYLSKNYSKLTFNQNKWYIETLNPETRVYINNKSFTKKDLSSGDVVFIFGLKIIVVGNNIIINNPNNLVKINGQYFIPIEKKDILDGEEDETVEELGEVSIYDKKDYFYRAPRFRTTVERKLFEIDSPPTKEKDEGIPFIYTLGPMLTMGLTSMVTGITTLLNILNKKQTLSSGLASLVVAVAMLMTMIFWPLLSKKYQKKQRQKKEKERVEKYTKYIEDTKQNILTTISTQRQILIENIISLDECKKIIVNRKRNLWERKIEHDDFLNLRLGVGTLEAYVDVKIPKEHFTLDEDNLVKLLGKLESDTKTMNNVPISISFVEKNISSVIGNFSLTNDFIKGLILQMITFHSYEDLKIVIFTNKDNESKWEFLKILPHCFSDDKQIRFFATDATEYNQLSNYLTDIYYTRKTYEDKGSKVVEYKSTPPYYVIITDTFSSLKNLDIINHILDQDNNCGFSLIINNERLLGLPNECSLFVNIDKTSSGYFENELIANKQKAFVADIESNINMEEYAKLIANIPIEIEKNKYQLPNCFSFLEMYNVGKVEQLNSISRWKNNNPISSLQAPIGVGENGELFRLDIHEKSHGPHGLVAGMTGSGKSEFLISYILSMAVNYNPNEVSFVLIDYKGGGLAGAFENKEIGLKLPHIAGTITNLDVNDMKRALASIESELKLRQRKFNEAREALNESTIDIYKYQRLYRNGQVKEPISHLIIISDEFAELKAQQPEFMDKLISAARIGRSLGVHLILATQKPNGIVNDQIWSNSKFRICLKVQDKSDSNEMIKRPDAASLKNVGRFYLQVGYNEFFALGQSAWAGAPYYKMEKRKRKIDNNIDFIDNTGEILKSIDIQRKSDFVKPTGEELSNIVTYLSELAKVENINIKRLWLDKIPEYIYIDNLITKYNYHINKYNINPIIGEYDVPDRQEQHLLTLPLSRDGNTIIYGASGSGKELMLSDIIYSIIKYHTVREVNFYILDFGAETLRMFKDAPQIGDILTSIDTEKIENLFKLLKSMIEKRKKLFLDYNGDYKTFCENSGQTVPTIIVLINNYEAFNELYSEYDDMLTQITREGTKYGVIFVVTTSGVNTIRYRLKQNFKQEICLRLNNETEYNSIFGNVNKLFPSELYGRGLIKIDNVYEFQTAHPYNKDKMTDYIKNLCSELKKRTSVFALKIPVLPKKVGLEEVNEKISDLRNVPIGIEKNTLKISTYDFKNNCVNIITANNEEEFDLFIPSFIDVVSNILNVQTLVFDSKKILKSPNTKKIMYSKENFDLAFESLRKYFDDLMTMVSVPGKEGILNNINDTVVIITDFEEYKNKLSEDNQKKLIEMLDKSKKINKIFFILVNNALKLKKVELESWYKNSVSNNNAIWLGNGLSEQFLVRLPIIPKIAREKLNLGFGFKIKNGIPILIKYLCNTELKEDE